MELTLLIGVFALTGAVSSGRFTDTRSILNGIYQESSGRSTQKRCYSGERPNQVGNEAVEDNDFLNMANFMDFVQHTSINHQTVEDAIRFFNISTAASQYGNSLVAQESFARAVSSLENYNAKKRRRRRLAEMDTVRDYTDVWRPDDLFSEFRRTMGDDAFNDLLHLTKRVVLAFVIDTSSSMENDMGHVKEYISRIIYEQERAGVQAHYVVTLFGDPNTGPTKEFRTKVQLLAYLDGLRSRTGGDCEEKTCQGMYRSMYSKQFLRKGNSAMYVFTDAGSKDCHKHHNAITRAFNYIDATAFFILFDSCRPNIDPYYAKISQETRGFTLLIRENAVYNITDSVNGAFENDALICGENSDDENSVVGQGYGPYVSKRNARKRRGIEDNIANGYSTAKTIVIDDLIQEFKVFAEITPSNLIDQIELVMPEGGNSKLCSSLNLNTVKSTADNGVVLHVTARKCPCTGNWTLRYPAHADSFSYSVKSLGSYTLSVAAYFVEEIAGSNQVANYAPCLGVREFLVIKLNQGEQVEKESLTAKIVGLRGKMVYLDTKLARDEEYTNTYIVQLTLPFDLGTEGFKIEITGSVIGGGLFTRVAPTTFYATTSCLRVADVSNYYALFPSVRTNIKLELSNNNPIPEVYSVLCHNTENYDIQVSHPQVMNVGDRRPYPKRSNPIELGPGGRALFIVSLRPPVQLEKGKTVTVSCVASSGVEDMTEDVHLTEMDTRLD